MAALLLFDNGSALDHSPDKPDKLQAGQGIDSGDHIIHHDTDAAMDALIKPGAGKGFLDVKEAEEQKTQDPGCRMIGGAGQGDEHAEEFIDDDGSGIGLI